MSKRRRISPARRRSNCWAFPPATTTAPAKITKDSTAVSFNVKTTPEARPGKYPSLVCRVTMMRAASRSRTRLGAGELRIDEPLPPKPTPKRRQPKPVPQRAVAAGGETAGEEAAEPAGAIAARNDSKPANGK